MTDLMTFGFMALGLIGAMIPWPWPRKSTPKELVLLDHHFNTTADKDKANSLEAKRSFQGMAAEIGFSMGVLATTLLSLKMLFHGLNLDATRENGPSLSASLTALGYAMGLTFCIFVTFAIIMKTMPLMKTRLASALATVLTLIFCVFTVSTSAWFSFCGMIGLQAISMNTKAYVAQVADAAKAATADIKVARGIPDALEAKAQGFRAQSVHEVSKGGATGSAGSGLVSQTLEAAAVVLSTGAASLREALAKADVDAGLLRSKLQALRETAEDRARPVLEREQAVVRLGAEIHSILAVIAEAGLKERVDATLVAVRSSVAELDGGSSSFGQRQRDAIARIRADMNDVASRLDAFSQRLVKAQGSEIPSMAGSLPEIAWTYKQHFIPMLLIALGIELFAPFALAWMAVYGMDGRTSRKGERFARPLQVDDAVHALLPTQALMDLPAVAPMTADLAPPTPEKPVRKPKGPPRA
jgi:hypothetical protein